MITMMITMKRTINNNAKRNDNDDNISTSDQQPAEINISNEVISSSPASPCENTGVGGENAGVWEQNANPAPHRSNEHDDLNQVMDMRYGSRTHSINLRAQRPRKYDHLYGPEHMLATFEQPMGELFMTDLMSLKRGL